MSVAFVSIGLFVSTIGPTFGIYDDTIPRIASVIMVLFGATLLIPRLSAAFSTATVGFAASADSAFDDVNDTSLFGQFVGGMLLGAVWSPCIGPTLGAAIALASQGGSLIQAGFTMASFALGVSTLIISIAYLAQSAFQRNRALMNSIAAKSRPILGIVFILVGLAIFFNFQHKIEAWAV